MNLILGLLFVAMGFVFGFMVGFMINIDRKSKVNKQEKNKGIESLQKIEKIERILFQDYKHRDCGSEDSWYLEDIMNVLKEKNNGT